MDGDSCHHVADCVRGSEEGLESVCGTRHGVVEGHRGEASEVWRRRVDSFALLQCHTGRETQAWRGISVAHAWCHPRLHYLLPLSRSLSMVLSRAVVQVVSEDDVCMQKVSEEPKLEVAGLGTLTPPFLTCPPKPLDNRGLSHPKPASLPRDALRRVQALRRLHSAMQETDLMSTDQPTDPPVTSDLVHLQYANVKETSRQ